MYIFRKKLAYAGIGLAILSTVFCPFLKVFLAGNWNLYQVDASLFVITNMILAIMLLFVIAQKPQFFAVLSKLLFVWTLLAPLAVYFKTNNYFGMKLADGLVSKTIHFQWGWAALIALAVLILLSVKKRKPIN